MANLRIPGPTPCPPDVLAAAAGEMINHRGPEFAALLERVSNGIQPFFGTDQEILLISASGTGAMEAAITSTLSVGDDVLAVSVGSFGDASPRSPKPTARRSPASRSSGATPPRPNWSPRRPRKTTTRRC